MTSCKDVRNLKFKKLNLWLRKCEVFVIVLAIFYGRRYSVAAISKSNTAKYMQRGGGMLNAVQCRNVSGSTEIGARRRETYKGYIHMVFEYLCS
jgi:hypothetical protein